jgi:hypothetical protein
MSFARAQYRQKRAAHTKCGLVEAKGSNRRWVPSSALKFKELLWLPRRAPHGLGIIPDTNSDNLTPQETTTQDAFDMGPDGASLSCPGSSVVADEKTGSG